MTRANYSTLDPFDLPVTETDERVRDIDPDLRTRFRWRAERRVRKLNRQRLVPFYRWEVVRDGDRWLVAAYQNVAKVE